MVDEVVTGEGVDDVALAAQVRGGDGDELAVARRRRDRGRPGEQRVAVGGVQRGRDEHGRIVAVASASTMAAIAASSPTASAPNSSGGGMRPPSRAALTAR